MTQSNSNLVFDLPYLALRQVIVSTMPFRHVIVLILSFQGIVFETLSKNQMQHLSNGKEIDQSTVTIKDLHRNIGTSLSRKADLNYKVKIA